MCIRDSFQYYVPALFFPMFSLTLASLRSNGALAARHNRGIGSSGRPGLNVSDVERAGVGLRFLFYFLRLTLLHYIYLNPRFSFHSFFSTLKSAYYYCKSFLPTIGGLDPRVPPGGGLLCSTVKLSPLAKIAFDTAENEHSKIWQMLPT